MASARQISRSDHHRWVVNALALATMLAAHGLPGTARAADAGVFAAAAVQPSVRPQTTSRQQAYQFNISSGNLKRGVGAFAAQTRMQLVYAPDALDGRVTNGVSGQYTLQEALERLLAGTGLAWELVGDNAVAIKPENARLVTPPAPAVSTQPRERQQATVEERVVGMPAIMVEGARTLNMDILRTEDDPQPYVVFDRDLIERSGATSVVQLLQQRLPMNTSVASMGSGTTFGAPSFSGVNLRGLGSGQTLILIDGHRMAAPLIEGGGSTQGDISGIPLAAIERIEILPSTASGIYGGSATGGVVNIITRKDYSGGEVKLTYDNTFSSDTAIRKFDLTFGHNFNQGKTSVLLSAGYSDANTLTEADRGFVSRGRDHLRQNNLEYYRSFANVPAGRRPNFVSVDGSDLVLRSGVSLGSPYASVPSGYGGVATDGGAGLVAGAGQHDWSLQDGALGLGRELYLEPTIKSGGMVLRHRFSEGLQAFVDLSSSDSQRVHSELNGNGIPFNLSADSPYNPFTTAIQGKVALPYQAVNKLRTQHERAVLGLIKKLPADWQASLDFTWDRNRVSYVTAPYDLLKPGEANTMDILRDPAFFPVAIDPQINTDASSRMTMKDTNIRFSGPLGRSPGGTPVLSAAVAYRSESAPDSWIDQPYWGETALVAARSTSASSAYMEYRIPFVSKQNQKPGIRELELQLAARYENYVSRVGGGGWRSFPLGNVPSPVPEIEGVRNEFSSVDPTIALRWKPTEDIALRMSYGTGFQPPNLGQLVPIVRVGSDGSWLTDPLRGNTPVGTFTWVYYGNPALRPESSRSWSAGMVFTPAAVPGLRMSVDYTRIEKSDNIGGIPSGEQGVIAREDFLPGRVVRGPNLPGDAPGWAGPITYVDNSPGNLARLELEALDVQVDYNWETQSSGNFDLFFAGTWQPTYAIQIISGAPVTDYVGLGAANPLEFKANAGMTWSQAAWRAGWNLNYFDSYVVAAPGEWNTVRWMANQGNGGRVPSQTYHDVFVNYDFAFSGASNLPGLLAGTQVQLGIRNIFNKRPPVDMAVDVGHAYYSPFGSPRLASYYLTVTTRF